MTTEQTNQDPIESNVLKWADDAPRGGKVAMSRILKSAAAHERRGSMRFGRRERSDRPEGVHRPGDDPR
jgi:hypothetical protein